MKSKSVVGFFFFFLPSFYFTLTVISDFPPTFKWDEWEEDVLHMLSVAEWSCVDGDDFVLKTRFCVQGRREWQQINTKIPPSLHTDSLSLCHFCYVLDSVDCCHLIVLLCFKRFSVLPDVSNSDSFMMKRASDPVWSQLYRCCVWDFDSVRLWSSHFCLCNGCALSLRVYVSFYAHPLTL